MKHSPTLLSFATSSIEAIVVPVSLEKLNSNLFRMDAIKKNYYVSFYLNVFKMLYICYFIIRFFANYFCHKFFCSFERFLFCFTNPLHFNLKRQIKNFTKKKMENLFYENLRNWFVWRIKKIPVLWFWCSNSTSSEIQSCVFFSSSNFPTNFFSSHLIY